MLALLTNWKTTLAGAAVVLAALADVATYAAKGTVSPNISTDLTAVLGGLGLVAAKDSTAKKGELKWLDLLLPESRVLFLL